MFRKVAPIVALGLGGCTWFVQVDHRSSIMQHFDTPPASYGEDTFNVGFAIAERKWRLEVTEGLTIDGGRLPREEFNARLTVDIARWP